MLATDLLDSLYRRAWRTLLYHGIIGLCWCGKSEETLTSNRRLLTSNLHLDKFCKLAFKPKELLNLEDDDVHHMEQVHGKQCRWLENHLSKYTEDRISSIAQTHSHNNNGKYFTAVEYTLLLFLRRFKTLHNEAGKLTFHLMADFPLWEQYYIHVYWKSYDL